MTLEGRVVAVTGAGHGYGRSISAALARAGCSVVLIGDNPDALSNLSSSLERSGGTAIPVKASVDVSQEFISAVTRVQEIFGALHGVVHSADRRAHGSPSALSEGEWLELFNHNIRSSVGVAQTLSRRVRGSWLTIVGPHMDERGLHVGVQRGALEGLTRGAGVDLRVNLVLPGRAPAGGAHDRDLTSAVLALAQPDLEALRGTVLEVPLPALPQDHELLTVQDAP